METETFLRIAAIAVAGSILLSNFDFKSVLDYVKSYFKRNKPVVPDDNNPVSFMDIIEAWHILRNQCEEYGLKEAVEKIDEVFPLLNTED